MNNEVKELSTYNFDTRIIAVTGSAEIANFDETLTKAKLIRDALSTVVVTPDTVRANKKLLAKLNKAFNTIDTERKRVKREFVEPFKRVDDEVKELKGIVDEATGYVRSQIRELEEIERDEKEKEIKAIWDKRVDRLDIKPFLFFEHFLTPKHLNKTTSMSKVEKEMADYISQEQENYTALRTFCETNEYDFAHALTLYYKTPDIASVINTLDQEEYDRQTAERVIEVIMENDPEPQEETINQNLVRIYVQEQDLEKVIELLIENGIPLWTESDAN